MHRFTCSLFLNLVCVCFLSIYGPISKAQFTNASGDDSTIYVNHTVFLPKVGYYSSAENWTICQADMDGDNDLDLIIGPKQKDKLEIYFNDGKGHFSKQRSFPGVGSIRSMSSLDFDKDGQMDIVALSQEGKIITFKNRHSGTLTPYQTLYTGRLAHHISHGDLNGDQLPDLVSCIMPKNQLHIYYGKRNGQFNAKVSVKTGYEPRISQIADIDHDGNNDLIVGCDDGKLYIHYGKGNYELEQPVTIRSGAANWALGIGDFNGDGLLDIASASYMDKLLCIHLNAGERSFLREQRIVSGDHNFALTIQDVDLDGDQDVVTCSTLDDAIHFHLNDGNGSLGPAQKVASGSWNSDIVAGDYDQDGDIDIATSSIKDHKINIHMNTSADPEPEIHKLYCIKGTIFRADSETPYQNAVVSLLDSLGQSIATQPSDREGYIEFCPKAGKTYRLKVRTPDFPLYEQEVYLPYEDVVVEIHLLAPKGTLVYGKVRNKETKFLIKDAVVHIRDASGTVLAELLVNQQGAYTHELPFGNGYEVQGIADGYLPQTDFFDLQEKHHPHGLRKDLELIPNPIADKRCMDGIVVLDSSQESIPEIRVIVRDTIGNPVARRTINQDGSFQLYLPIGYYDFSIKAKGYFFEEQRVEIDQIGDKLACLPIPLTLKALVPGAKFVLKNIYYDVDKATLRPSSMDELDKLISLLEENPNVKVELSSHTDSDGSDEYNIGLSQKRAQSVVNYLLRGGISSQRLVPKGYGENQPVVPNTSPKNKQLNRRTEFKVLGYQ